MAGKHRKPTHTAQNLRRAAVTTVGGAAALGLTAGPWGQLTAAQAAPVPVPAAVPVVLLDGDPGTVEPPAAAPEPSIYTVVAGDWLSTIAPRVGMDWHQLYADNQAVVGDDPDVIFPGQELVVKMAALPPVPPPVAPAPASSSTAISGAQLPILGGAPITSDYGSRWGDFHDGLDFDCAIGDVVVAADAGVVEKATDSGGGYGNEVRVRHADGSLTFYGHMDTIAVELGATVAAGQQVGTCGNTGHVVSSTGDGSHLHFGAEAGPGLSINPRNWLADRGVAL